MNIGAARKTWGQIALALGIAIACLLFFEVISIDVVSRIPRHTIRTIPWLKDHYDDRSLLRILIPTWFASIGLLPLSLFAIDTLRRKALIATASGALGAPLLMFGLMAIDGWLR